MKIFAEKSLTKRELNIFLNLPIGNTYSKIVRELGRDYPESTIKYVLRNLRKKNLIICGNSVNRGILVRYTFLGNFLFGLLGGDSLKSRQQAPGLKKPVNESSKKCLSKSLSPHQNKKGDLMWDP